MIASLAIGSRPTPRRSPVSWIHALWYAPAHIMDDPRTTAKTAREGLARGLQLLQDPQLPPPFLTAAEPIARAMGTLMQVERGDGNPAGVRPLAEQTLLGIRDALGRLQSLPMSHPAAEQAMASVASSLALVHGLTRLGAAPPGPPPSRQQQAPQQQFQPPPQQQFQAPQPQFQPPQQQYQAPPQPAYPQPQFQPPPQAQAQQPQPQFQPPRQQYAAPQAAPAPIPSQPAAPKMGDSLPPPAGTIEAELGAHSASNFYKTLSGNDIVDHGGIFVATYNVPQLGSRVSLRVHLPGGYHFDCGGLVKWTRDAADNPDSPPGFGAQFQGMSAEQRQLVQRYVRNREPLFYDDL